MIIDIHVHPLLKEVVEQMLSGPALCRRVKEEKATVRVVLLRVPAVGVALLEPVVGVEVVGVDVVERRLREADRRGGLLRDLLRERPRLVPQGLGLGHLEDRSVLVELLRGDGDGAKKGKGKNQSC